MVRGILHEPFTRDHAGSRGITRDDALLAGCGKAFYIGAVGNDTGLPSGQSPVRIPVMSLFVPTMFLYVLKHSSIGGMHWPKLTALHSPLAGTLTPAPARSS